MMTIKTKIYILIFFIFGLILGFMLGNRNCFIKNQKIGEIIPAISTTIEKNTKIKENGQITSGNSITKKQTYIVKEGDCLWSIAEEIYKDGKKWQIISYNNSIINPDLIYVGAVLKIE